MRHESANQTRLLTKLIRDILARQTFDTLADLNGAIKDRCAKLKLSVTDEQINSAFTFIAKDTPLVRPARRVLVVDAPRPEGGPLTRAEAARILAALSVRLIPTAAVTADRPEAPADFPTLREIR